ncbi:MAG: sigma-70 family RNA polymerase sigma factor [Sphingobacterium sp.]|jgi:RNA polymerase sigma factor (sigma-70 family)|nr:sigma-70 family RNA polymerase sigma factor [Sphingobacterium sp.]
MWSSYRHITREEHAYRTLLQQYDSFLFLLISKKIQKREDAKDVLQNVLIHLWEYRKSFTNSNIEAILIKTCTQKIAEYYRKNAKLQITDLSEMQYSDNCNDDLILLEEKEEHLLALEKALEDLFPPIRREIFKMNKLQGVTQEQISINLNIPKRTVEYHISQSLIFLKNKLKFLKKS